MRGLELLEQGELVRGSGHGLHLEMPFSSRAGSCMHPYACTVHFFLSTVDLGLTRRLYITYPISTSNLKKKLVNFFLHANVCLKSTDGHACPSIHVLNRCPNPPIRLIRQPWICVEKIYLFLHSS